MFSIPDMRVCVCEQLVESDYMTVVWLGVKPTTSHYSDTQTIHHHVTCAIGQWACS